MAEKVSETITKRGEERNILEGGKIQYGYPKIGGKTGLPAVLMTPAQVSCVKEQLMMGELSI